MTTPSAFRRRFMISTNVLVQCLAVLVLLVMINWLVSRHYSRLDWTRSGYYKLSDKTKQVLATLKEPLKIIVYFSPESVSSLDELIYDDARNMVREFKFYGRNKVSVEYVDPDRDRLRAAQIVDEYKINSTDPALVIFASGAHNKYVGREDMADIEQGMYGGTPRLKAFKAEGAFLSAIQMVTEGETPTVYFLTGHGEHDPESFDQRLGYSGIAAYIKRDNLQAEKWNLMEKQEFPTNAAAIIIAGPTMKYTPMELAALDKYLKNRGRLFVMLDPKTETGLEDFVRKWGVQVDKDMAMRRAGTIAGNEAIDVNAVASTYGQHPITAKLAGVNTEFPYSRSVRKAATTMAGADSPRVTELAYTGKAYWGIFNPDADRISFDPVVDIQGPLPLAVAVESGQPRGVDVDLGVTRLVVAGSSQFIDNEILTAGNLDFFMSSLDWLLKREQLLAVGPKQPEEFRLNMTESQVNAVYALTFLGLPLSVGILGILVWLRRRK